MQITRVPPIAISAEPVAVRMKPGSIVTGRSSSGRAPVVARLAHAAPTSGAGVTSTCPTSPDRELEEARADRRNASGSAEHEEAVLAAAVLVALEPALAQRDLDLVGDRLARADDLDPAAERALEHAAGPAGSGCSRG